MPYVDFDRKYEGLAKFPAVTRDLSMVVPKDVLAGDIEAVIAKCGGKLLENCSLFDIYEGSQIKEGFKSMAYSLVFRSKEKTLLDTDIEQPMNKILTELGKMNIELRS
jgi:phenylalanyl-tRNA synthetase beta chain